MPIWPSGVRIVETLHGGRVASWHAAGRINFELSYYLRLASKRRGCSATATASSMRVRCGTVEQTDTHTDDRSSDRDGGWLDGWMAATPQGCLWLSVRIGSWMWNAEETRAGK